MDTPPICPSCGQSLTIDSSRAGHALVCPSCGVPLSSQFSSPPPMPDAVLFCPQCGERNAENNFKCTRCGFSLHSPPSPQVVVSDGTLGGLIPVKNSSALIGYYLGVFSLIPCAGIPLGIAAVLMGIKGLKFAKSHPEAKGAAHAWVAIVLGGIMALIYTLMLFSALLSAAVKK